MSGMGDVLSDFIRGLYWVLGILAGTVVLLLAVIAWLVIR